MAHPRGASHVINPAHEITGTDCEAARSLSSEGVWGLTSFNAAIYHALNFPVLGKVYVHNFRHGYTLKTKSRHDANLIHDKLALWWF